MKYLYIFTGIVFSFPFIYRVLYELSSPEEVNFYFNGLMFTSIFFAITSFRLVFIKKAIFFTIFLSCFFILNVFFSNFFIGSYQSEVFSPSMYPTFEDGDVVYGRSYKLEVKEGNILAFIHNGIGIRKRVFGVGGDTVLICNEKINKYSNLIAFLLVVNNIKSGVLCKYPFFIPDEFIFFLGDNYINSYDSRDFRLIHQSKVDSQATFIIKKNGDVVYL